MGKGDKKLKDGKRGANVAHTNPFNSMDFEDSDDESLTENPAATAAAGGGGGGGKKKTKGKGGKGKKKKEQEKSAGSKAAGAAAAEQEDEEQEIEFSNPALLDESPRSPSPTGGAETDRPATGGGEDDGGLEDQAGADGGGKKGRMRAYLDKKEEEYREQEKARMAEAKKRAKEEKQKKKKKKKNKSTRVENPFDLGGGSDDSDDSDGEGEPGEAADAGSAPAPTANTSTYNPMQVELADDESWLEGVMKSGSVDLDDEVAGPAPDADKSFKVKQTAWKGKKIRGHRVKASVTLIVSQMSMRIMDGDVPVCNILYQDVHDWEVGAPKDKGGKPTIEISLQAGSPSFTALGPLVLLASKHAAAIAAQLTFSVTGFREEVGKGGYTPPKGASGGIDAAADATDAEWAQNPAASTPRAADGDAEEGVPPEGDGEEGGDSATAPDTVESLRSKVAETTQDLDGLEDELEARDDVIEDLREQLSARDAAMATLEAKMAVLTRENAALKASLGTAAQGGGDDADAAAGGFVAAAADEELSIDSIFAAAREADAAVRPTSNTRPPAVPPPPLPSLLPRLLLTTAAAADLT
jgi:hypothetical protein